MIEITLFVKEGGALSKKLSLGDDGKVIAEGSACTMIGGVACRVSFNTIAELPGFISDAPSNEAIAIGSLRNDLPEVVNVLSKRRINGNTMPDTVARTARNIIFKAGAPAFCLLDFDRKGMPAEVTARIEAAGGFWRALTNVAPVLGTVERVIRPSTSSGLSHGKTKFPDSGGLHVYIVVRDGADIPRFLKDLHRRCIVASYGWHILSASGALLERSIIDASVGSPERLIFEGAPVVTPPLVQAKRSAQYIRGPRSRPSIDSLAVCPPLTPTEYQALDRWRAEERVRLEPEARRVREEWIRSRTADLAKRQSIAPEKARQIIEKQSGGVLLSPIELPFDDPELVGSTVADVLANPERYEGETLADPIEGVGYGAGKAKILIGDGETVIHSFAHGLGTIYRLRHDATAVRAAIDTAPKSDAATVYVAWSRNAVLDAAERELLEKYTAARADVGVKVVRQMIRDADAQDRRRDAEAKNQRVRAADNRSVQNVPAHDDERLPVIVPADDALAERSAETPPMRDVENVPLEVRHRAVPLLHEALEPGDGDDDA